MLIANNFSRTFGHSHFSLLDLSYFIPPCFLYFFFKVSKTASNHSRVCYQPPAPVSQPFTLSPVTIHLTYDFYTTAICQTADTSCPSRMPQQYNNGSNTDFQCTNSLVLERIRFSPHFGERPTPTLTATWSTLIFCFISTESSITCTTLSNGTVIDHVNPLTDISLFYLLFFSSARVKLKETGGNITSK